jgi:DAK2 domain fusion protein YloV
MTKTSQGNVFLSGSDLRHMILEACNYFELYKESINELNVYPVPDGDTGTNMCLTMTAAAKELQGVDSDSIGEVAKITARSSLMGARGNSGVILSQLFRGIARGLSGKEEASLSELGRAFQYGIVYAYNAVNNPVEGTILTVAREIAKGSREAIQKPLEIIDLLRIAIESGRKALDRTPELLPVLKEAGVVDAGGLGLIVFLEGCLHSALKRTAEKEGTPYLGEEGLSPLEIPDKFENGISSANDTEEFNPSYPYCTELLIKGENISLPEVRKSIETCGDSIIVAGDGELIKVHIHTAHPGTVLEKCLEKGSIHDIKIENMIDQYNETRWSSGKQDTYKKETAGYPLKNEFDSNLKASIGAVTVSSGEGLSAVFNSLGTDKIISGGQSMNPSVKEIVDAIMDAPAEKIIVLPNNSNIRLSAQQAAEIVDKEVKVVDTRSIPQGIAALLAFDRKKTLAENYKQMSERALQVKTGEITYATRDATVNNITVSKGDIIGISDGNLLVRGDTINGTLTELVNSILAEEDEILTLFYGQDVTGKEAREIAEHLGEKYPYIEVELQYGGQSLYYYLLSIE